jgi:hypothetical protein
MPNRINIENFACETCNFVCTKQSNYDKHLSTVKHKRRIAVNGKNADEQNADKKNADANCNSTPCQCICGKKYKHMSSLCTHKKICTFQLENSQEVDKRDDISEIKEMMMMMIKSQMHSQESTKGLLQETQRHNQETLQETLKESQRHNQETLKETLKETMQETQRHNQETTQEILKGTQDSTANLVNKVIEVLPQLGNTTNNNNTLNFYLNDTCKDAESIHDFTDRFIERVVYFFKGNYRDIAYKRISLPDNVRDIFYECLADNPQTQNFVQTTDVKNGVFYVKEKKKNEDCQFYGEAEFVKYKDGFAKSGTRLGHAINCALLPCKSECLPILERDFKAKPNEDDYDEDHDEEFQQDKDTYYNTTRAIQDNLMFQTINAMNIFDNKRVRENTLTRTKRAK